MTVAVSNFFRGIFSRHWTPARVSANEQFPLRGMICSRGPPSLIAFLVHHSGTLRPALGTLACKGLFVAARWPGRTAVRWSQTGPLSQIKHLFLLCSGALRSSTAPPTASPHNWDLLCILPSSNQATNNKLLLKRDQQRILRSQAYFPPRPGTRTHQDPVGRYSIFQ